MDANSSHDHRVEEPTLTGLLQCRIAGEFFSTQRHVHLANDILFIGDLRDVEHVVSLENAVIIRSALKLTIKPTSRALAVTVWLDNADEADRWERMLDAAKRHPEKVQRIRERSQSRFSTPSASPRRGQTPKRCRTPRRGVLEENERDTLNKQLAEAMAAANRTREDYEAKRRAGDAGTQPAIKSSSRRGREPEMGEEERDMLYSQLGQVMAAVEHAKEERENMRKERDAMHVQLVAAQWSSDQSRSRHETAERAKNSRSEQLGNVLDKIGAAEAQWLTLESKLAGLVAFGQNGHNLKDECEKMREMHTHLSAAKFAATAYGGKDDEEPLSPSVHEGIPPQYQQLPPNVLASTRVAQQGGSKNQQEFADLMRGRWQGA